MNLSPEMRTLVIDPVGLAKVGKPSVEDEIDKLVGLINLSAYRAHLTDYLAKCSSPCTTKSLPR